MRIFLAALRMVFAEGKLWKIGLIPQAVANGLASILVLFFVLSDLHGGLLGIGLVTGVSALALIPSQVLWGRLIDAAGRCKPFLVLGFLGMGLSFVAFPWAGDIAILLGVVSIKSILYAATLPARQLLTVESEGREGWTRGLANMQFLTAMGETVGMGIGAATVATLGFPQLFFTCGVLCFVSAAALGVLSQEPGFMIQRRMVALERSTSTLIAMSDLAGRSGSSTHATAYESVMKMLNNSTKFLMVGIFGFSLAGSAFYSPLPAYFLQFFSSQAVFLVFFGGSLVGALSYLPVGRLARAPGKNLILSSSMRMLVIPLLLLAAMGATPGIVVAAVVLAVLEGLWSLFDVSSAFSFLENARIGQAGFYGALVGLGSAGGGFMGGFVSLQFGFSYLFAICSVICAGALAAFVLHFRGTS